MSLFIANAAFPDPADYAAAKIGVFLASSVAAALGVLVLWQTSSKEIAERSP
jgi:NhaA family Na+:H+ antiporter